MERIQGMKIICSQLGWHKTICASRSRGELIQMQQEARPSNGNNFAMGASPKRCLTARQSITPEHCTSRWRESSPTPALHFNCTKRRYVYVETMHIPLKSDDADLCLEILWASKVSEMSAAAARCHSLIGQFNNACSTAQQPQGWAIHSLDNIACLRETYHARAGSIVFIVVCTIVFIKGHS